MNIGEPDKLKSEDMFKLEVLNTIDHCWEHARMVHNGIHDRRRKGVIKVMNFLREQSGVCLKAWITILAWQLKKAIQEYEEQRQVNDAGNDFVGGLDIPLQKGEEDGYEEVRKCSPIA